MTATTRRAHVLVVPLVLIALLTAAWPAAAQTPSAFVLLGTDATGDDATGFLSPGGVGLVDTSEADDIVDALAATGDADVLFKITLAEMPGDGETTGQLCWMPAFEVVGHLDDDGVGVEYVALVCATFTAGEFDAWTEADTNRGEEVASGAEFLPDETAILIRVPLENLHGGRDAVLRDVYVLTYHDRVDASGSLYVDDALPDAKSDRDVEENLGCYVVATGTHIPAGCDHDDVSPGPDVVFEDLVGDDVDLTLSFPESTDAIHQFNWTASGDAYDIEYAATVDNGSVAVRVDANGVIMLNETYDADVSGTIEGAEVTGDVTIRLTLASFQGDVTLRMVPPPPEPEPSPEPDTATGNETAGPAGGNQTDGEDGGSLPGFGPVAAALGVVAAAVVARRRRA